MTSLLSTQSLEVSSKVATSGDEVNDNVKSLTEKLSAALLNVGAKDDLVKQRAKVVEEAVAGWEKVENGMVVLKQQVEAETTISKLIKRGISLLSGATFSTTHFIPDSLQPFPRACMNPCIHLSTNCSINRFHHPSLPI